MSFAGAAQAGIVIEPYAGYGSGHFNQKDTANVESNRDLTAGIGGLRLGLRSGGLWLAADGMTTFNGHSKHDATTDLSYTRTSVFGVLGYDFMTRVRLYVGAGFSDSMLVKDGVALGDDITYSGGTPLKFGMGYWLARHMCLNIEYVTQDFKKYKHTGLDGSLADAGLKSVTGSMVLGTLSFPLTLF